MEKVSGQAVVMPYFLSPIGEYCITEFCSSISFIPKIVIILHTAYETRDMFWSSTLLDSSFE